MKTIAEKNHSSLLLQICRVRSVMAITAVVSMILSLILAPNALQANPSGANVVHGAVNFNGLGTSNLTINQSSNLAIINWQDFSIGVGERTTFVQPSASSLAINRVISGNPSAIYGTLKANGGVILINPNGILVGPSGVIDVAGSLTLSTLDASNTSLINGFQTGSTRFTGLSRAAVRNMGSISAGDVSIVSQLIENQGRIDAARNVSFGAGSDMIVNRTQDGATISVQGGQGSIENTGSVIGGNIDLSANGNAYGLAINNGGMLRARGFDTRGGRLRLSGGSGSSIVNTGDMYAQRGNGEGGEVEISAGSFVSPSGRIDASGADGMKGGDVTITTDSTIIGNDTLVITDGSQGGNISLDSTSASIVNGTLSSRGATASGGNVDVSGDYVSLGSSSMVDVSGTTGGSARLGGGLQGNEADIDNAINTFVNEGSLVIADGSEGDAGKVIIWADNDTLFKGEISAQASGVVGNGGFVEVSGKQRLLFGGAVDTGSVNGENGILLLDPTDMTIGTGASTFNYINDTALSNALTSSNVIIHTGSPGAGLGDITVESRSRVEWNDPTSLTLLANNNVEVYGLIKSYGEGNVNLFAGWDGVTGYPAPPLVIGSATAASSVGQIDFAAINGGLFGTFGNGGGSVYLNSNGNDQAVEVGSRLGETNVFGHDLVMTVSDVQHFGYTHLGYRNAQANPYLDYTPGEMGAGAYGGGTSATSGNINVRMQGDVQMLGIDTHDRAYIQIGHGAHGRVVYENAAYGGDTAHAWGAGNQMLYVPINMDHSGDVSVHAGLSGAGDLIMLAGREQAYTKIGHGGYSHNQHDARRRSFDGTATEIQGYTTGGGVGGAYEGDIEVLVADDILSSGRAGSGSQSFSQIGHGGYLNSNVNSTLANSSTDLRFANMDVHAAGGANTLNGLRTIDGELSNDGNALGDRGDITVEATNGSIQFYSGGSTRDNGNDMWAKIGHGGRHRVGEMTGDISVKAAGPIIFEAQVERSDRSYVQVGHGGIEVAGPTSGSISVESDSDITFKGGREDSYAMVGHGGRGGRLNTAGWANNERRRYGVQGALSGDINVNSGGDINFRSGGDGNRPWSQIGHGGFGRYAYSVTADNSDPTKASGFNGDITVTADGDIDFRAHRQDEGYTAAWDAYSMIGHGGIEARGDHSGEVTVTGASVRMESSGGFTAYRVDNSERHRKGARLFSQIGHGGHESDHQTNVTNLNGQGHTGAITVTALSGGVDMYAPQVQFRASTATYLADNDYSDTDYFTDYADHSWSQIGHGGNGGGSFQRGHQGAITVTSADYVNLKGSDYIGRSQLMDDGDAVNSHRSQLNHVLIGHGGQSEKGLHDGDITVNAQNDILVEAGPQYRGFGQIGHGGYDADSPGNSETAERARGTIIVDSAAGSVAVKGGQFQQDNSGGGRDAAKMLDNREDTVGAYGSIGHSSWRANGTVVNQDIFVNAGGGSVEVISGTTQWLGTAQIGHGEYGQARSSEFSGNINVYALTDIDMQASEITNNHAGAGVTAWRNNAVIGHGAGRDVDRQANTANTGMRMYGTINVVADTGNLVMNANNLNGDLDMASTSRSGGHVQIGHGGQHNRFSTDGQAADISVRAGGDIDMTAGNTLNSMVAIGHGGIDTWGRANYGGRIDNGDELQIDANINVLAGNNLTITENSGANAYAKIGHGDALRNDRRMHWGGPDQTADMQWDGDVHVSVGNDANLTGAFIGHVHTNSDVNGHGSTAAANSVGDTFFAVSRNNPDFLGGGTGSLTTDATTSFSSGNDGVFGELRLYMPNRPQNNIASGTLMNSFVYTDPGLGTGPNNGVSLDLNDFRADEYLDYYEHQYASGSAPVGSYSPEGPYSLINGLGGFYGIYYNNEFIPPPPPPPPVTPTVPPGPVPFDFGPFLFGFQWEAFDQPDNALNYDGYDDFWGGLNLADAIDDGRYVPRSGIEEQLDARLGSRRWVPVGPGLTFNEVYDGLSLSPSDAALERAEERDRILTRANRAIGKSENVFYLYQPGANVYSSLRLFGNPAVNVPKFAPGQ